MKGIIIYKSNYGSTKQYAKWLQEDTSYEVFDLKEIKKKDLIGIDLVILGCPVFANTFLVTKWIKKNWALLESKKIILFTCSGADVNNPILVKIFTNSFNTEMQNKIKYFPLGGRMIFNELTPLHTFFMKLGMKMEKNPIIREEMGKDTDAVDRNSIKSILDYIHQV